MGALASLDQRAGGAARGQGAARRRRAGRRRPGATSRWSAPTRTAAPSCRRCCCAATTCRAAEPHDVEAFGPVSTRAAVRRRRRTRSSWPRAARAAWSARWSPTTRPSRGSSCSARPTRTAASWCSTATTPRENTGHGSPLPVLVHGGPGPRRRRRGARRHPRRAAPHAAHRRPGLAGHAHRDRRPLGDRRAGATTTACTRSASRWPSCGSATRSTAGPRAVTLDGHRALRRVHRRHLLRAHGRGGGRGQPAVRRPGRARLPDRLVGGGPVRRPRPGPGAGQLRRRQPALPHPGQAGGGAHASRSPPSRSARAAAPTTARCAGTPSSSTARASRWRPTTS